VSAIEQPTETFLIEAMRPIFQRLVAHATMMCRVVPGIAFEANASANMRRDAGASFVRPASRRRAESDMSVR